MHTTLIFLLSRSSTPGDFQNAKSAAVSQEHHLNMEFFPIPPPGSNPFAVTTCEDRGCVLAILSGHQSGLDRSTASLCFPNLEDDFRKSKRGVLSAATFRGDRQEDR